MEMYVKLSLISILSRIVLNHDLIIYIYFTCMQALSTATD